MPTKEIIIAVRGIPTGPWRKFRGENGISSDRAGQMQVARLLKPFGLKSKTIWLDKTRSAKGYFTADLVDAAVKNNIRLPLPELPE